MDYISLSRNGEAMRNALFEKIKEKIRQNAGFTLLEMILATALIGLFFTMAAMTVPVWYKVYAKSVNINYARQIAGSVMGAVEYQIRFANDIELEKGSDGVERLKGKYNMGKFSIPMEGTDNLIDGLVYDDDFFIHNDIKISFDLDDNKKVCTVTVEVLRDEETVLIKSRGVMLVGRNETK